MDRTRTIADRVANELGIPEALDALGERAAAADLTPVLLDIMRSRAGQATPAGLVRRHSSDRFVTPSPIDLSAIRRAEDTILAAVPDDFEQVMLSPLVPLGTHHVLGQTPQNNVISTVRRSEVAADPTAGLALEAATRRSRLLRAAPSSPAQVKLATAQRVTRAQTFDGPRSFAHFGLVGLVTAGRDTGNREFEKDAVVEQVAIAIGACLAAGATAISATVTDFSGRLGDVVDHVVRASAADSCVEASVDPDRTHARGYYPSVCFKVRARFGDQMVEYGDGGLVDWGARLLGNAKERMMISGLSVDRIAMDMAAR